VTRCPSDLNPYSLKPAVTMAGITALTLAGTLVIAGADLCTPFLARRCTFPGSELPPYASKGVLITLRKTTASGGETRKCSAVPALAGRLGIVGRAAIQGLRRSRALKGRDRYSPGRSPGIGSQMGFSPDRAVQAVSPCQGSADAIAIPRAHALGYRCAALAGLEPTYASLWEAC
jgi:hypothetical protein